MPISTVVIEKCPPETADEKIHSQVAEMLSRLPGIEQRLERAKRIFIKLNLGIQDCPTYKNRPVAYTDPAVYEGVAKFLQDRTAADVLVGDGTDLMLPEEAARLRGHMDVVQKYGHQFLDLNKPPYTRFKIPRPVMFRWYELSSALNGVDLWISIAKMKSHHLCGVTLTLKNLFGIPPNLYYASPRVSLHSPTRLPRILSDLGQICSPAIGVIDGIIGQNYYEWGGDPVSSGVLIAGDNLVSTDSVGARFMGVDPNANFGTPPFIRADNHLRIGCETGLGPIDHSEIHLIGDMPSDRLPFTVNGASENDLIKQAAGTIFELGKNANAYFRDREQFVQEYRDELIMIHGGKVFFHQKVDKDLTDKIFKALNEHQIDLYESFNKLVEDEEAELSEPYEPVGQD